jgi:hypothetical protein
MWQSQGFIQIRYWRLVETLVPHAHRPGWSVPGSAGVASGCRPRNDIVDGEL